MDTPHKVHNLCKTAVFSSKDALVIGSFQMLSSESNCMYVCTYRCLYRDTHTAIVKIRGSLLLKNSQKN